MNRLDMKLKARQLIKGKVFVTFIPILIVAVISSAVTILNTVLGWTHVDVPAFVTVILTLVDIALFVFGFVLSVGLALFFLEFVDSLRTETKLVFAPIKRNADEIIKAKIVVFIYVVLGLICLIVPGIIIALKYAMIDYVLAERPKLTYRQAMRESARMMEGKKGEYFVLQLSFILWHLFAWITCCIGYIYVAPYIHTTVTLFYDVNKPKITGEDNGETIYQPAAQDDGVKNDNGGYTFKD